ncbi:MAG: NADH:ubiquinone reductase (Na(+)-transporting) subunit C [Saprospiraceae bacterium]|nr:NADH:ubiquinone reductase (Na(+)-transporting) subunit C [Bacteroidia bacterium]NNE15004.1 NADH:ubiquinone reductase (Na(+)-transporting) subunit C [Saprospiraceae bacterium]NNL91491.1 NADH:ubiquinone reductase (Na(+)-transporting) subunit C [Saprospiraceae bacterium]
MHSTGSIIRFVLIMTSVVALLLAGLQNGLKSTHELNESLYSKKATLAAVANHIEGDFESISDDQVQTIFENQVKQLVVDNSGKLYEKEELIELGVKGGLAENIDLGKENKKDVSERLMPLYEYTKGDGSTYYILYTRGKGLWDEIWGNIALESDLSTIAGVSFDHKQETPGLGAEIKDNKSWVRQFIGKKIYTPEGEYKSVYVRKGGAKDDTYEVDGISGATITADGVSDMLKEDLKAYEPYFKSLKS